MKRELWIAWLLFISCVIAHFAGKISIDKMCIISFLYLIYHVLVTRIAMQPKEEQNGDTKKASN